MVTLSICTCMPCMGWYLWLRHSLLIMLAIIMWIVWTIITANAFILFLHVVAQCVLFFLLEIHFAIIIDNHEEIQGVNRVSKQVDALKKSFERLGFCVLYFNFLSSQSISCLLEAFHQVDYLQLASFALVFLSKGHTNNLYASDRLVPFKEVYQYFDDILQVPKLFLFHLAHSGEPLNDQLKLPNPPKNSIALVVSIKLTANMNDSPAIDSMIINLKPEKDCVKPLQHCFEQMKHHIDHLDLTTCDYKNNLQDNFVLPTFCGENDHQ